MTNFRVAVVAAAMVFTFACSFPSGKGGPTAMALLVQPPASIHLGRNSFVARSLQASVSPYRSSSSSSSLSTALRMSSNDQTYQKVFLAGASKGVGRCIAERLSSSGTHVVCLVRSDEAVQILSKLSNVTPVKGDAFVYKDVETAMDGCDAAITTLGGSADPETGSRIDYVGNNNVIEAAGILGVTRVVLVTSIGCGNSKEAAPPSVFEALREVLSAKERAENILQKYYTNMNWTIVRPGGLKSERATGTAILTEDNMSIGSIHREDVADLVVRALNSAKTERKVLSAVDPEITSAANKEGASWEPFEL